MSEEIVTTDAGAVTPQSPTAEPVGETTVTPETTSTGTEPEATTAEPSGTDAAPVEGAKAPSEPHQKTMEQRVQELVSQREVEIEARLTAKLQEATKPPEQLNFIPDLDMAKVNEYIRDALTAIEQARLDGDFLKAADLQDELDTTRREIKGNEARKAEYMRQQESRQLTEQQTEQINQQIQQASALVAKEHNIPPEVWKAGEDFFLNERRTKPLIDAQYRERVMLNGPVSAMLWAKEYVEQNMGKKEEALINQKEAAKELLPAGKTSGGVVPGSTAAADLAALKAQASSGNPSDMAAYSKAKREASQ